MADDQKLTELELQVIADSIKLNGQSLAIAALERAYGGADIALAMLGVAASRIMNEIEPVRREQVIREYLGNFNVQTSVA